MKSYTSIELGQKLEAAGILDVIVFNCILRAGLCSDACESVDDNTLKSIAMRACVSRIDDPIKLARALNRIG